MTIEIREGHESPNKENLQFIRHCESVSNVHIDATGYQAGEINYVMDSGLGFAVRVEIDRAVKDTLSEIKDCEWRPLVFRDGSESDTEQVCRTLHAMTKPKRLRW